jgi:hypothetical protein
MKATAKMWSLAALVTLSALPQQAASQVRPSTPPSTPAIKQLVPGQGVTRVAPAPSTQVVSVQRQEQVSLAGLGGKVYSTGLEEVYVRIIPVDQVSWKLEHPYVSRIYVMAQGKKRFVGSNFNGRVVRLGRLPAGEINLGIDSFGGDAGRVQTGSGERNPDGLPHATVRALPSGVVEVRFEDLFGLPEGRDLNSGDVAKRAHAQRNFLSDVIVQFSGGVTADGGVLTVLESLKDSNPEVRRAAAYTLRTGYPRIARSAGVR